MSASYWFINATSTLRLRFGFAPMSDGRMFFFYMLQETDMGKQMRKAKVKSCIAEGEFWNTREKHSHCGLLFPYSFCTNMES